jgi:hypothetical protein
MQAQMKTNTYKCIPNGNVFLWVVDLGNRFMVQMNTHAHTQSPNGNVLWSANLKKKFQVQLNIHRQKDSPHWNNHEL